MASRMHREHSAKNRDVDTELSIAASYAVRRSKSFVRTFNAPMSLGGTALQGGAESFCPPPPRQATSKTATRAGRDATPSLQVGGRTPFFAAASHRADIESGPDGFGCGPKPLFLSNARAIISRRCAREHGEGRRRAFPPPPETTSSCKAGPRA